MRPLDLTLRLISPRPINLKKKKIAMMSMNSDNN